MSTQKHAEQFAPPEVDEAGRRNLVGLSREELTAAMAEIGQPAFRARQLWHWIYHRGATDFAAMTNLSKEFRAALAEQFMRRPAGGLGGSAVDRRHAQVAAASSATARKWRPSTSRKRTAARCASPRRSAARSPASSATPARSAWCATCRAPEIVGQIMLARDHLGEWPSPKDGRMLSNIVMMGMGEPLYNYDNVAKALKIVMDHEGIAISRRRITLSTAGVVPMIERCGAELGVKLAISLHAVTDELRDRIVPINKKYPIAELLDACRNYPGLNNARRITFEYVMLKGVNDSPADARALVRLLKGIPAKVNLIPFNPWPGAPFERSTPERIAAFSDVVFNAGYASPVRTPRGEDIMAACGQLKSASVKERRSARDAAVRAAV